MGTTSFTTNNLAPVARLANQRGDPKRAVAHQQSDRPGLVMRCVSIDYPHSERTGAEQQRDHLKHPVAARLPPGHPGSPGETPLAFGVERSTACTHPEALPSCAGADSSGRAPRRPPVQVARMSSYQLGPTTSKPRFRSARDPLPLVDALCGTQTARLLEHLARTPLLEHLCSNTQCRSAAPTRSGSPPRCCRCRSSAARAERRRSLGDLHAVGRQHLVVVHPARDAVHGVAVLLSEIPPGLAREQAREPDVLVAQP